MGLRGPESVVVGVVLDHGFGGEEEDGEGAEKVDLRFGGGFRMGG